MLPVELCSCVHHRHELDGAESQTGNNPNAYSHCDQEINGAVLSNVILYSPEHELSIIGNNLRASYSDNIEKKCDSIYIAFLNKTVVTCRGIDYKEAWSY